MDDEQEIKTDSGTIIEDENLKKAAKKGVSITISLVMLGFSGWKDLEPEKERGGHTYVEAKLNKALSERLKDLDDKIENAEHSRSFFGDEMYKKLIEIDASRGEALVHDRDGEDNKEENESPENEVVEQTERKTSANALLGSVVLNTTMANMKFKSRKGSRKGKSPGTSFKANAKTIRKSFLEENIKNAGKTAMRKKSIVPPVEKGLTRNDSDDQSEKGLIDQDADEKKSDANKEDGQEKLKKLYQKEKNDLQQAYDVLLDEYKRRRAVRKNILSKFGRASNNLKIILAQKRAWNDPNGNSGRSDSIREVFVAKPISDSKGAESRGRFRYNRFDDVDRI